MKKRNIQIYLACLFTLIFMHTILDLHAGPPRIMGYFADWNAGTAANVNNMQYQKLTHLNYFALNPTRTSIGVSDGNLWIGSVWFTAANFNAVKTKARTVNPGIKIFISSGGAPGSDGDLCDRLSYIGSTPAILNKFCNNVLAFIKANQLDGWDLDWEFPGKALGAYTAVQERQAHQNMLAKMRFKMDSMNLVDTKMYEISIAVGGGYSDRIPRLCWNPSDNDHINTASLAYADFVNIMTYDGPIAGPAGCAFPSHQDYNMMVKSVGDWAATNGLAKTKMMIGTGFYDNNGANLFKASPAAYYAANPWGNGGGDGCNNMINKLNYINTNCMAGIFIWELTMDNLCAGTAPACYSLLDCIYQNKGTSGCSGTPIVLVNFSVSPAADNKAYVQWHTASETKHDHYILQSSVDGLNFSDLGKIYAKGSANQGADYNYIDSPESSTIYYRLVIVSIEGDIEYSKVISLNRTMEFSAVPNPFNHIINLTFNPSSTSKVGNVKLIVFNSIGKEMLGREVSPGENSFSIGEEWPLGLYIINVVTSNGVHSYKVEKQ